ncbi:hypothetical protein C7440_1658 [Pusillimonas noertemannii]|uniref:Type VI secretion system spike protein VgrG3-like C-terminal domain-containing protein n=2 Tax=Pusillimonas noertemannii TaxID=305977 RepID=A0A2U1CMD1_9BURK|nr:hypothetical protein C7440_1658 [Pusillimonas noertemannii]
MLKHDDDGFLTGDPIDLTRAIDIWGEIQADVAAIRQILSAPRSEKAERPGQRASAPARREVATPSARGTVIPAAARFGNGRQKGNSPTARASNEIAQPRARAVPEAAMKAAIARSAAQAVRPTARRDASGRFVAGAGKQPGGDNNHGNNPPRDPGESTAVTGLVKRLSAAVSGSAGGIEEADPTVKAFNEIAQPLSQGYSALKGLGGDKSEKKKERWYRRIFGELRSFRKEETAFSKATNKTLKEIEKKPDEGGGGGGGGLFGGLFAKGGIASGAAMLLKKIPVLGGLIASAGNIFDIFSSESDDSLSRGEKDVKTGKGVGGLAGTLGGMWAGAKLGAAVGALGGPIGAAIGGVVGGAAGMFFGDKAGQVVGETVGGWVADLRSADIGGMISQKWEAATTWISNGWDTGMASFTSKWNEVSDGFSAKWGDLTKGMQSKWEGLVGDLKGLWGNVTKAAGEAFNWVKDKGDQANAYIKDVTGVDVKETAKAAVASTKEVAASAIASVKSAGNAANDYVKEKTGIDVKAGAGRAVDAAREGAAWVGDKATSAKDWVLGKTSKLFESGKGGAATVSTGKGDFGGASYGTYQLASKTGTLQKFLDSTQYGEQFKGMTPGTKEFNAKWKQVAKDDPAFGDAQHNFIKQTHFDPQMEKLQKSGIDLSGRGAAVKDSIWSTSVQFGGKTSLIEKALKGRDTEKMSDAEIVSAIQDYKIQNNDKLFASSSAAVRKGTLNRASQEKEKLLALAQADAAPEAGDQPRYIANQHRGSSTIVPVVAPGADKMIGDPRLLANNGPDPEDYYGNGLNNRSPAASPAASPVLMAAAPAHTVSAPAVTPPSVPAPPAIAEAPKVPVPLGSGDNGKPPQVNVPPPDAGQDVRDRRIAHIVTGGYSS